MFHQKKASFFFKRPNKKAPTMKSALTLLLLLVVGSLCAQAGYGVTASYNFNSFRGNSSFNVTPGLGVGGFFKYQISGVLTPKIELTYFQQGALLEDYIVSAPELSRNRSRVTFHSVHVPLLMELSLPSLRDEPIRPKLSVGGFYNFIFYSEERFYNTIRVPGYPRVDRLGRSDVTGLFEQMQYGLIGALGGEIQLFSLPVALEFRYLYNINPISKDGTRNNFNLRNSFDEWGNRLYLGTVSFNIQVTL
jgi:hypothetical protein